MTPLFFKSDISLGIQHRKDVIVWKFASASFITFVIIKLQTVTQRRKNWDN